MSKKTESGKIGRNAPCPCGSGRKYKHCCVVKETGPLQVQTSVACSNCAAPHIVDLGEHALFRVPDYAAPLRNFAREHGTYLFQSFIKVVQVEALTERLWAGELTALELLSAFEENATREVLVQQLNLAVAELPCFERRSTILRDVIDAHFEAKFSLSVPVGFILVEGVLRELGDIALKDDLAISIPYERWEHRLMPEMQARAWSFRAFLTDLYKGSQVIGSFNRNPVLHGGDVEYARKHWSLMLLMTLYEIRLFMYFRAQPEIIP